MSAKFKALMLRVFMTSIGVFMFLPGISMAEESETKENASDPVSDDAYQSKTKEEKQRIAVQDSKNAELGIVKEELTLGATVGSSLSYSHVNHKFSLADKTIKIHEGIIGKLKKDYEYTLEDEYKTLYSRGAATISFTVNAKLFDTITPSTNFYIRQTTVPLFDGELNNDDIPEIGVTIRPHYFKPIQNNTLWKLLDIDSKRNLGNLTYGFTYAFGYFYDPYEDDGFTSELNFSVSHNNFDPLGPINIYKDFTVRGTISSSATLSTPTKVLLSPGDYQTYYSTKPSIRFSKTFESGDVFELGFIAPITAYGIPLNKVTDSSAFVDNTYQSQIIQFYYQKIWSRLSNFTLFTQLHRDGSPSIMGKKPLEPSGHHKWVFAASLYKQTG